MDIESREPQTKDIQDAIKYLKENLSKSKTPIFIELVGTPKSGKTTLTNAWKNLLEKNQVPAVFRRETAEYNPIKNKSSEEYRIWMIMELIKNLSEDLENNQGKIIIYDRGLLDRIAWIEYGVQTGIISPRDSEIIKQLYTMDLFSKYRPLVYGFITSPELSIQRKGEEGKLINRESIEVFNKLFSYSQDLVRQSATRYSLITTDSYQGRLQEFILDITERMIKDSSEFLKEKSKEEEENYR